MKIIIVSDYYAPQLYVIAQILKNYPQTTVITSKGISSNANGIDGKALNGKGREEVSSNSRRKTGLSSNGHAVKRAANGGRGNAPSKFTDRFVIIPLTDFWSKVSWKVRNEIKMRRFFPDNRLPDISNGVQISWNEFNGEKGLDRLKALSPDILVTINAPLLRPEIFRLPKIASVNLHPGILPYYRGVDPLFWALYFNDFSRIGGTILHINKGVDRGNLLAEVYPSIHPFDGYISLEYKINRLLAVSLLKFLKAAGGANPDLTGRPQNGKGRNFRKKERLPRTSLEYLIRRTSGVMQLPRQDERILTYFR